MKKLFRIIIAIVVGMMMVSACSDDDKHVEDSEHPLLELFRSLDWGNGTCFVFGHKTPDVDAVTSSMACAKLMRKLGYNCEARVSSSMNKETHYIAERLGFQLPEMMTSVAPGTRLIVTDHGEYEQSVEGAREAIILQLIDHHSECDMPEETIPYIRRELLGSTCTIIYNIYHELGIAIDDETARLLLAGIVSDTRNLTKPATTDADRVALDACVAQLHLEDEIADIAAQMKDMSMNYDEMTDEAIFLFDYKDYQIDIYKIGIASLDTFEDKMEDLINRMLAVMPSILTKKNRDMVFAKVDNLVANTDPATAEEMPSYKTGSYFLYYGDGAKEIAESIFGPSLREGVTFSEESVGRKVIVERMTELLSQ